MGDSAAFSELRGLSQRERWSSKLGEKGEEGEGEVKVEAKVAEDEDVDEGEDEDEDENGGEEGDDEKREGEEKGDGDTGEGGRGESIVVKDTERSRNGSVVHDV